MAQDGDVQEDFGGEEEDKGRAEDQVVEVEKEEYWVSFRKELQQIFGDQEVSQEDQTPPNKGFWEGRRKVLGVTSGTKKAKKDTWWWNVFRGKCP